MLSRLISLSALALSVIILPVLVSAQELPAPEVANSKYQFTGTVNANAVYVRSGPGENYYPTMKLDKGTQITVVGIKFDWLKVTPPQGSYSYVAKAYVEKRGDGSVGRVTKPDLNVRAGSGLNAMKTTVQTKLNEGVDVKILGEQDEYFKIAPPEGSFVYVNKQFIDPGQPLVAAVPAAHEAEVIASAPVKSETPTGNADLSPSTQPVAAGNDLAPSTQPVAKGPTADQQFDKVEAEFVAASDKPIQDQSLTELKTSYEAVLADGQLPVSMRRMAELRVSTLKFRIEAQDQYTQARKAQDEAAAKNQALKAEQEELAARIKANEVTVYTAIGMLRTSSLQQGNGILYRLTDPTSGRTLVYLRSTDGSKVNGFLGQLIGVKGEVSIDPVLQAKSIAPTDVAAVDAAKVNNGVTAGILPSGFNLQRGQFTQAGNR